MTSVVDAVSNLFTPPVVASRPDWSALHMASRFSVDTQRLTGVTVREQLREMDAAGIERAILVVQTMGASGTPGFWHMDARAVIEAIENHGDRFSGQVGIDPTSGVEGIRRLRSLVQDHGFVGAHYYPHWFDLSPNASLAYPFYETCTDLGVPIQIQVGQALIYNRHRPMRSLGQPIELEPIALQFPNLRVIGSHLGYPWTDEMIALAHVHPNVFICTDSYAPKHWPERMNAFVAGEGNGKVMFGTMWPTIGYQRAIDEIRAKGLSEGALANLLGGTAISVYQLADKKGE